MLKLCIINFAINEHDDKNDSVNKLIDDTCSGLYTMTKSYILLKRLNLNTQAHLHNPFLGDSIFHWMTQKYIWSFPSWVRLQNVLVSEDRKYWSWCPTRPRRSCWFQPVNLIFSSPVPCLFHIWPLQRSTVIKAQNMINLPVWWRIKATAKFLVLKAFYTFT